jgi:hypothetical protein
VIVRDAQVICAGPFQDTYGVTFTGVAPTDGGVVGEIVRFVEQAGRPMRMYTGYSCIDRIREP